MSYVDGFVVPVPKRNLAAYKKLSEKAGKIWREHGAIDYKECVGDDVKMGKITSFPQSVKLQDRRGCRLFLDNVQVARAA